MTGKRNELEVYFADLNPEAQKKVLSFYGCKNAEEGNLDVFPLFTLEV